MTEGGPRPDGGKLVSFKARDVSRVQHDPPTGAGTFGMTLFLVSLSILFTASVVGVAIVRFRAPGWAPEGSSLPAGLWASTAIILGASAAVHWGYGRIKRGDTLGLQRGLTLTLLAGLAFLVLQTLNWILFVRGVEEVSQTLFGFSFYILTGLHALHVLAGLIQLGVVAVRAAQGRYTADSHGAVWYSVMYWHFLDGTWLVLFAALTILV